MYLAVSAVASAISTECSVALAQYQSPDFGSEEEKSALETLCAAECGGELARFFKEECGNNVVAEAFVGLCSQMNGVRCYYISEHYNWTAVDVHCGPPSSGQQDCSSTCAEVIVSAVETVGCCSHYGNFLPPNNWELLMSSCVLDAPEQCPDPFQEVKEEEEETDKEEEEETDKPTEDIRHSDPSSAACSLGSGAALTLTCCLLLFHVFLCL